MCAPGCRWNGWQGITSPWQQRQQDAPPVLFSSIPPKEELVAEMTASFLNARAGIMEDEIENSAAYLQSWINALRSKDAQSWIVRAASQGQKAADFILGRHLNIASEAITTEPHSKPLVSFVKKVMARETSNQQRKI